MICVGRTGVRLSGALSLGGTVCVLLASLYCLIEDSVWLQFRNKVTAWIQESHRWDSTISTSIQSFLDWLHRSHNLLLLIVLFSAVIHLVTTCMLITATFVKHRRLLVPWLVTDLLVVLLLATVFITITFISFFIDLMIAIVFPIMGGLLLGVWIVLWRNAFTYFRHCKY